MRVDTEISNSPECFVVISLPTFYITITEKGTGEGEKGKVCRQVWKAALLAAQSPSALSSERSHLKALDIVDWGSSIQDTNIKDDRLHRKPTTT